MSRGLGSTFKAAAAAGNVNPSLLAYFDFSGGPVRVWAGYGDLTWDGYTWAGIGDLGQVSPVQETGEVRANKLQFRLGGVPSTMVSRVLGENYRRRPCKLWLALFDDAGAMISSPSLRWAGLMDQCQINDSGASSVVTITAESRLVELQRSRERRRTDQDQQNLFPGDRGLEYVVALQDAEVSWGARTSTTNGLSSGGSGATSAETAQIE